MRRRGRLGVGAGDSKAAVSMRVAAADARGSARRTVDLPRCSVWKAMVAHETPSATLERERCLTPQHLQKARALDVAAAQDTATFLPAIRARSEQRG